MTAQAHSKIPLQKAEEKTMSVVCAIMPAIGILTFLIGAGLAGMTLVWLVRANWHITSLVVLFITVLLYLPALGWAVSYMFGWNR